MPGRNSPGGEALRLAGSLLEVLATVTVTAFLVASIVCWFGPVLDFQ